MFTVKIVQLYPCKNGKKEECIEKTRIFTTPVVEVDEFPENYILTINESMFYTVPKNYFPEEDWKDDGMNKAIYIENANGKTVHAIRSSPIIGVNI